MELILTVEERELLTDILEERHKDLQREISHSDHITFKRMLRHKENLLESVMEKLDTVVLA